MDPEMELVLTTVPEFAPRYVALAEDADEDPGAAAGIEELATFVAELLSEARRLERVLARALGAVEDVLLSSPENEELVAGAFLESLAPDELEACAPRLGSATRAVLADLEVPHRAH